MTSSNEPLVAWREEFEIGIAEVDYEHRALINLINEFYARVVAGETDLEDLLGEIFSQISAHFALEEKDMSLIRWQEFDQHKEDHETLLDDLRDIMDEAALGEAVDISHLGNRLGEWFTDHFRTYDARLHRALH